MTNTRRDAWGAVDLNTCPTRTPRGRCKCPLCEVCGFPMHMAVHGPALGAPAGSAPYDHRYIPPVTPEANDAK